MKVRDLSRKISTRCGLCVFALSLSVVLPLCADAGLHLTEKDVLEAQGLSVLLFHNLYHPVFGDQKMSGMEIMLHGERIATNGDVRLSATPAQWDAIPNFETRRRGPAPDEISASCSYPDPGLSYRVDLRPEGSGLRVAVQLDHPIPEGLAGKAGFNLEFLPSLYFGKSYVMGGNPGIFPRHADGPMERTADKRVEAMPLAEGQDIVLAPDDPLTRISITSDSGSLFLFDGRNQAQNGWFVVRSLIPSGKTGDVVVWACQAELDCRLDANSGNWLQPGGLLAGSRKGGGDRDGSELRPAQDRKSDAHQRRWRIPGAGKWMRYQYAQFDFSPIREPGVYAIEYAGQRTGPFRIGPNVYDGIWGLSLNTYLAEQMDHVKVNEGYHTWHGASHLDDARQAPINYTHFDGYKQGPTTDSPFSPGQHIPGLNVGGWFDAGDFDLRTQTQTRVIMDLAMMKESFGVNSDNTSVDETARVVQMRKPDGIPDIVQQIEHGIALLLAQYHVIGHAIPGIIEPTLEEYTYLGDAASKTDGRIYQERMKALETDGIHSGLPDDRWAFTTHTTALSYDAVGALAAASRVLRGFDDKTAGECLSTAMQVWDEEHKHPPTTFRYFNTTGSDLRQAEVEAAVELLIASKGEEKYRQALKRQLPVIRDQFAFLGGKASRAIPLMDEEFSKSVADALVTYKLKLQEMAAQNPYGVPISTGTWGGSGTVARFGTEMYFLHRAFPETVGPEYTLHALDYLLGRHPVSSVSYVSGVGAQSKLIAYGNNRADYTFIPGGMIPGVTIIQPDFPELKEGWPYLWYENEYVVDAVTSFILVANAAHAETKENTGRGSAPAK